MQKLERQNGQIAQDARETKAESEEMIIVRIELHSARTGEISEIGRMYICNDGTGTQGRRNYDAYVCRRGQLVMPREAFATGNTDAPRAQRTGRVNSFPSKSYNVWRLISRAVRSCFQEEK